MQSQTNAQSSTSQKRAALSIVINLFLAIIKAVAGFISHSNALLSDAIHSACDVLGSGAAFIGIWVARQNHPSFPYGLYKAETIATLVSSIAILTAAYEIGKHAISGPSVMPKVGIALPVTILTFIIALGFGLFQVREGKRLSSPALEADGKDYLTDSLSTAVVLIGLIGAKFGYNLDRWAALIVSLFVFKSGGELLWHALKDLMDAAIDRDTEREIVRLVESHPRVDKVERVLSRTAGGRFIVDLDVVMNTPSHELADKISDSLEAEIQQRFPRVCMARVRSHFHPSPTIKRITPLASPNGELAPHIAKAPWFLIEVIDKKTGKILNKEIVENPHKSVERKRGFLVGKWLLELHPDQFVVPGDKEGTVVALLKEAGTEIIHPQRKFPPEV